MVVSVAVVLLRVRDPVSITLRVAPTRVGRAHRAMTLLLACSVVAVRYH